VSVSVLKKKRSNAKPKQRRITFDIQVKAALASPFSTEQQGEYIFCCLLPNNTRNNKSK
jgi:hypothetical protein